MFIAGMPDARLRAFDKETGELLFEALLRAASFAAPAVYEAYERQFDCPRHPRRAARVRAMPPPHLPRSDPRCEPSRRHTLVYDDTRAIEFEVTP